MQIIPPPSNKNYKKVNKYYKINNNKIIISPYQNVQNIKLNFHSNKNNIILEHSLKNKNIGVFKNY